MNGQHRWLVAEVLKSSASAPKGLGFCQGLDDAGEQ